MNAWTAIALALLVSLSTAIAGEATLQSESIGDYNARMQWFVDAQYGMFIHFGVYTQLGGEWQRQPMRKWKCCRAGTST
jgi:alpha-L-fucosidase